jgi:Tol biopolymer transport system component
MVMDGNGDALQWVGNFSGSPAWSPDGRLVAVGCPHDGHTPDLCIVDISTLPDQRDFPAGNRVSTPSIVNRIQLPEQCEDIQRQQSFPLSGILSTSWSHDATRIAVVCGNEVQGFPKLVCILALDGNRDCWDDSNSSNIYRAIWSPTENLLAISGPEDPTSKIYLVNPDGADPTYLADGWSPEWSPDSDQLAFITAEHVEANKYRIGIAAIDTDGTHQHWLFQPDASEGINGAIYFMCAGIGGTCRLTWSPDGRYIAFVSSAVDMYSYHLYRLDTRTGKITILLDRMIFRWLIGEPDWGP